MYIISRLVVNCAGEGTRDGLRTTLSMRLSAHRDVAVAVEVEAVFIAAQLLNWEKSE
jgi:hypothetical protein